MRVPLEVRSDSTRGLPRFLNNNFCGTGRKELLMVLYFTGLYDTSEILEALRKADAEATSKH